jgi:hypothetical protein
VGKLMAVFLLLFVSMWQVAYKQNGRWLTPDHGFPVRMLIPGHIGGRMVKWLTVRLYHDLLTNVSQWG